LNYATWLPGVRGAFPEARSEIWYPFDFPNWLGYIDFKAKDWGTDGDGVYPQRHTTMTTLAVWAGGLQPSASSAAQLSSVFV
jgi:hypothetical protein